MSDLPPNNSEAEDLPEKRWKRETVEQVLEAFLSSRTGEALVLQGPWGAGKTYFWNQIVQAKLLEKPWKKRYSYVSLFGINSLPELKVALAVATEEFDQDARNQRRLSRPIVRWFWAAWRWLSDLLTVIPRYGSGLSKLVDRIGFYMVRDRVICFDDIERHGNQLDLKDFLGLVSYLSELRSCRVIVILNSKQLPARDQEIWDEAREKVFQGELSFRPTAEETVELGLAGDRAEPWHDPLQAALVELRIPNIRLVRRSAKFMQLVFAAVGDRSLRADTIQSICRVVAMLVLSIHGRGAGGPPLERVHHRTRIGLGFSGMKEDKRSDQEKEWDRIISDYRIYLHTGLDEVLIDMVQAGYPDGDALRTAVDEIEGNNELYAHKQAWHDAWRLYHDTVAENGEAIVAAFERTWPPVSAHEHANNLQSSARLLRMLGRPELATKFIRQWVAERSGDRFGQLDDRELHLFRKIDDPEILGEVEAARTHARELMPLSEAFQLLREGRGYPETAVASLGAASVDEIVGLIDATEAENLAPGIRHILEMRGNPGDRSWMSASEKMQQACERIAARSPLAADRMKNWFGIEPREAGGAPV